MSSCNGIQVRKTVNTLPRTMIERESKAIAVTYNPGMMSAERAEDLFMAGVSFMATPLAVILHLHWVAICTALLTAICLYDGLKRPADTQGK